MANIRRIKAALVIIFVTQLQNIRQKHWLKPICESHDRIVQLILKGLDLSDPFNIELYVLIDRYLKEVHDPIENYPWDPWSFRRFNLKEILFRKQLIQLYNWSSRALTKSSFYWKVFTDDLKGINMPYVKELAKKQENLELFDSVEYSKWTDFEVSLDLLTRWRSKISFLELASRVNAAPKETIKDISETSMISLLTAALLAVKIPPKK
jgi:hypothetical protein